MGRTDDGVDLTFGLTFQSALMPVISSPSTPPRQRRWRKMKGNKERKKGCDTTWRRCGRRLRYLPALFAKQGAGGAQCHLANAQKNIALQSLENIPSPLLNLGLAFLAVNLFHQPSSGTSLIGNKSGQKRKKKKKKKETLPRRKTEAATHFGQ